MSFLPRRTALGCLIWLAATNAGVAQPSPNLTAFAARLIDLPGWTGEKPDTMSMTQGAISVSYAARRYEKGDSQIMTMLGRSGLEQQAQMATGGRDGDFTFQSGDSMLRSTMMRGFRVFTSYNAEDKDGMILVYLGESTTFSFQFNAMTLDEAMVLAQRFDWAAMQQAAKAR